MVSNGEYLNGDKLMRYKRGAPSRARMSWEKVRKGEKCWEMLRNVEKCWEMLRNGEKWWEKVRNGE